jgi:hypothetical protein
VSRPRLSGVDVLQRHRPAGHGHARPAPGTSDLYPVHAGVHHRQPQSAACPGTRRRRTFVAHGGHDPTIVETDHQAGDDLDLAATVVKTGLSHAVVARLVDREHGVLPVGGRPPQAEQPTVQPTPEQDQLDRIGSEPDPEEPPLCRHHDSMTGTGRDRERWRLVLPNPS